MKGEDNSIMGDAANQKLKDNKLLLISLGNIQNYISNARKTIDLYNGSAIVKRLVLKIQDILYKQNDDGCFYIEEAQRIDSNSVPNFLLYKITWNDNEKDNNKLIEDKIYQILRRELEEGDKKEIPLDIDVFIVVEDLNSSYDEAYKQVQEKFQAYKNNRFQVKKLKEMQCDTVKPDHICSLCGIRYGTEEKKEDKRTDDTKEYLCNECRNKRGYSYGQNFKSVEDIAKIGNPSGTYYAIIRADFDDMGKWMSGQKMPDNYGNNLYEWQNQLKQLLKEFFDKIVNIIQKCDNGNSLLIYAGGDDLLCFCPLSIIISALKKIEEVLDDVWKKTWGIETVFNKKLTMTKCVTIAHIKTPLKRVVQLSSSYLEKTKQHDKNEKGYVGFAYINSGFEQSFSVIKVEKLEFIKQILDGIGIDFSRSIIYELERQLLPLGLKISSTEETLSQILRNDIQRVVSRKCKNREEHYINAFLMLYFQFIYNKIKLEQYFNMLHILDKWAVELPNKGGE